MWRRVPVDPNDWRTELRGVYWLHGGAAFIVLFIFCFTPLTTESQSNGRGATLLTYLVLLFTIHAATLDYASQRPGTLPPTVAMGVRYSRG